MTGHARKQRPTGLTGLYLRGRSLAGGARGLGTVPRTASVFSPGMNPGQATNWPRRAERCKGMPTRRSANACVLLARRSPGSR